jgi:hypothetical protein
MRLDGRFIALQWATATVVLGSLAVGIGLVEGHHVPAVLAATVLLLPAPLWLLHYRPQLRRGYLELGPQTLTVRWGPRYLGTEVLPWTACDRFVLDRFTGLARAGTVEAGVRRSWQRALDRDQALDVPAYVQGMSRGDFVELLNAYREAARS